MKSRIILFVALALPICATGPLAAQQSIIAEEEWTIKTYPFSDPDPVPVLAVNPSIYPYHAFNGFSHTGTERSWKVIRLENDYVRVFVLPEAGGKVFGAVEKSTGKAFIYQNDVLKFRRIALRGPWTSGGIEFNFGIVGHAPSTATPVDYVLRENPDGSVSCFVGATDWPSRTRWQVEIRLPPDKAFFETRTLWYNPSPYSQSYYTWTTAAVSGRDDLQYYYPGRLFVPHGYGLPLDTWPVDHEGRDLSRYKNNNFGGSKSYFVVGAYGHFFGGYWHDDAFGMGHWALYDDMPGQKIWIWALSGEGAIWEDLLTDTRGQYSEPQAGRLFSQSDHASFDPYTADTWREVWFPFKAIGGLVDASPYGALNVERDDDSLQVGLSALQALDDDLVVRLGGTEVYRERLVLGPMDVYTKHLALPQAAGELEVSLGRKLSYSDDPDRTALQRPLPFRQPEEDTAEGLCQAGAFQEQRRTYDRALGKYEACLAGEPRHVHALTRLAELYSRRGEYERGLAYAARALEIDMYNADANYVYGVIARRMGNLVDAKETLGWASRSMKYRSNAYAQIAELYAYEQDFELALDYAQRALDFNRYNIRAYELLAVAHRKLAQPDRARAVLAALADVNPLNHLVRFERYLLDPTQEHLETFTTLIRNEMPREDFLEMALSYHTLGLDEEAVSVLRQAPSYPTVHYWLAYLQQDGDPSESRLHLQQAGRLSPRLVFPFREETIPVLEWASRAEPSDWKARYYLGLIHWAKGRTEKALALFEAGETPDFAPFYLAKGRLKQLLGAQDDLSDVELALAVDPDEWRAWHELISRHNAAYSFEKALDVADRAARRFPDHVVLAMDRAGALFNNRRYAESLAILQRMDVLPYEGSWEAHDLFVRTQVHLAMEHMQRGEYRKAVAVLEEAKTYPERLGSGAPFDPDVRLQEYLQSLCYEKMNEPARAEALRQRITDYTLRHDADPGSAPYAGILTLEGSGKHEEARQLSRDWAARTPEDPTVQWYQAKLAGDQRKAREIEEKLKLDPRFRTHVEAYALMKGRR